MAILMVHGGTSLRIDPREEEMGRALDAALGVGEKALAERGAAAGVVAAVRWLEDSGLFLAGAGSEPQRDGVVRKDASLVTSDGRAGAVQGASGLDNPIEAARLIHEKTGHSCLVGEVSVEVLRELGATFSASPPPAKTVQQCVSEYLDDGGAVFGTVGAVALDGSRRLAAATSTGGYPSALPGRSGDSGAIGVGTVATPRLAVSCTGDGDRMLPIGPATRLDAYVEVGESGRSAARRLLRVFSDRGAVGGFLLLGADGELVVGQNVPVLRFRASREAEVIKG